jgi:hypothetical protein
LEMPHLLQAFCSIGYYPYYEEKKTNQARLG